MSGQGRGGTVEEPREDDGGEDEATSTREVYTVWTFRCLVRIRLFMFKMAVGSGGDQHFEHSRNF